jgi:hypothetical protein
MLNDNDGYILVHCYEGYSFVGNAGSLGIGERNSSNRPDHLLKIITHKENNLFEI